MLNNFVKSYPQPKDGPAFQYTTMVRHNGTVIAFAVNAARRVLYSVLDLSDQGKKGPLDVNYWQDNPQELLFPTEVVTVGEGLFNPRIMPVYKKGASEPEPEGTRVKSAEKDLFRSTTASLTELAPIQVVSDHKFVYVFRQSQENEAVGMAAGTLLVDRFVLSGINLLPKREVRYQRSRNKFTPKAARTVWAPRIWSRSLSMNRPRNSPLSAISTRAAWQCCCCPPRWPMCSAGRSSPSITRPE